jgi:hypothetical protein
MKICFITHTTNPRTGGGVLFSNTLREVKNIIPNVEYSVITREDIFKDGFVSIFKNLFKIRKEIKRADFVHAFDGYPYGVVASMASIGTGKPVVITAIGSGSVQLLGRKGIKTSLLIWAYKKAKSIVAISRFVAKVIEEKTGLKAEVINPGIDYVFFGEDGPTSIDSKLS